MSNYWADYPGLASELKYVKKYMLSAISDALPIVKEPVAEVILSGGKMLRPALVILGAKFGKYKSKRIIPIATSVELLHTATLIHDDIIDESKMRRGIESIQSKYSKDVAVLIGDYIFAKTFDILSGDYPPDMLKKLSYSIMRICEGELSQHTYRYSDEINLDKYIEIIAGKTAALFSMSLFVGAYEAKVKKSIQQSLVKVGYCIGMMFQIIDDCLDYHGDSTTIGKHTANDIKQGYITLPMFYALQNDNSGELHGLVFKSDLSDQQIIKIKQLVIKHDGVGMARNKAKEYSEDAFKELFKIKKCESRDILEYIIQSLIQRTY